MKKRILVIVMAILFMFAVLLGRLMQIQLFQTEHFSKHRVNLIRESVKQRTLELVLDDGRGQFLDSEGSPLSFEKKTVLVLFPFIKTLDWKSGELARILNIPQAELQKQVEYAEEPFVAGLEQPYILTGKQTEKIEHLDVPGVFAVEKKFPAEKPLAAQLIGIYGENEEMFQERYPKKDRSNVKLGLTGLQKQFDEFLLPERESKLVYHVDGIGHPLFGIQVKYTGDGNPFYPLQVKTTIRRPYQEKIEDLLDLHHIKKGGAILLDVQTNEVLAAASRPHIDRKTPFSDEGSVNWMFKQLIPGSVFKTVVAAAAIEEGLVNKEELYNCNAGLRGEAASRQLGNLNFEDSFAQSCNITFAELAWKLVKEDPEKLEEYAEKMGAIGSVSWEDQLFQMEHFRQFDHDNGRVFANEESRRDRNYVFQTGIGQQEVRLTPVSVANMMATIARGGQKMAVKTASEIQYGNGTVMATFAEKKLKGRELSPYTAMQLQQLLRKVVTAKSGTGNVFQTLAYEVAGKSGTAETAREKDGEQLHHKWFAGYFPFNNPKYALVVVNLDVPSDEGGINMLFGDIVSMVYEENKAHSNLSTQ
ncbi:penicillin-binding transpeptidase domain-containing protein [Siminovitchia sp. FSL H7-0308]|uniref:peptidoglycan D,D-transpeptidase FtsI family protein n=1 Tax=Siminovitchia sp. FSL H7-0308 TaxID=2921432 RepID=UPI0030EC7BEF